MALYKVFFYNTTDEKYSVHYVWTNDMMRAKTVIEGEDPYTEVSSWELITPEKLPPNTPVLQK